MLAECEQFATEKSLQAVFATRSLSPWRDGLPKADSVQARVDGVIDYQQNKFNQDGRNALVEFVRIFSQYMYTAADGKYYELVALAEKLDSALEDGESENRHD